MGIGAYMGAEAMLSGINNLLGLGIGNYNREENYYWGERQAENADKRTRALYADLYSPKALMKQYKDAGLSPSLMFGGTPGQGGTSGAMGSSAAINTPYMPMSLLEAAQIKQLEAETEKTKAETENIDPIAKATVADLLANAGYKEAAAAAAKAQAAGQELQNYILENTKDASIYQICELAEAAGYQSEAAYYQMKDSKLLYEFNKDTFEERKQIVSKELESLTQSIAESKSAERLNDQQRKYLKDQILASIQESMTEWGKYELSVDQFETFIEKQIPIIEKELDVKLAELDLKNKKLIIDAVTETFKGLAMGAMAASSMGLGKGGLQQPKPSEIGMKPVRTGGQALKGKGMYKMNNVWGE